MELVAPNGGETWRIGTRKTIRWESPGHEGEGEVRIEISRDGGKSWSTLFAKTVNDGIQNWTVTGGATGRALIRVRGLKDSSLFDTGDKQFEIK
jgi:hypothetical protein